jgi:outer membrane lipoprotein SlyB
VRTIIEPQANLKAKEIDMLTRTTARSALLMCVLLLSALGGNLARAESDIDYGTVTAIEIYRASENQPINPGTVIGGIAGGVIGHQIGSGGGKTAATVIGTIGGAVVGNQIEKSRTQGSRYRITVKLDSGTSVVFEDTRDVNLRVGDRVRVEDNRIHRL